MLRSWCHRELSNLRKAFGAFVGGFEGPFEEDAGFGYRAFLEETTYQRDSVGYAAGWSEFRKRFLRVGSPVAAGFGDFDETGAQG